MESMTVRLLILSITLSVFFINKVNAAEYYVATTGSDSNSGSETLPWRTIQTSMAKLKPGDTLNVTDGTYSENLIPKISGTAQLPILVRAITPFAVTIDGGGVGQALSIRGVSYLVFEGFKLKNAGERAVLQVNSGDGQPTTGNTETHHIALRKISVQGSCALKNCTGILIARSNDVLLEDAWAYGSGRYTFLVYGSRKVTVRRVVIRWDYWDGSGYKPNDPRTAVGVYNSHNNLYENVIVLDSGKRPPGRSGDKGSFTLAGGDNGSTAPFKSSENNEFFGVMIFNNIGLGFNLESRAVAHSGNYFENSIVYGNSVRALTINKKVESTTFNHMTLMGHKNGGGYANWSSETSGNVVTNSIVVGNNDNAFNGEVTESYNMLYANAPNYANGKVAGNNSIVMNPEQFYIFRNDTVPLSENLGSDGKRRGSHLIYRYFNGVESEQSLWPWLYEDHIYKDFCDPTTLFELGRVGENSAGWCESGKSLTRYLWNAVGGDVCPKDICDVDPEPLGSFYTNKNNLPTLVGGSVAAMPLVIVAILCGIPRYSKRERRNT